MGRKKTSDVPYITDSQEKEQRTKISVGIRFPPEIVERLRNLVWATGHEGGVNDIVETATISSLERLEAKYHKDHGKPVPVRPGAKLDG